MRRLRVLLDHPMAGPSIRYVIAGAMVAVVYLAGPLLLNGVAALALQVAIPVSYVAALSLHFNLQRHFVFRHVSEFALSRRGQIMRYVVIAAVQYPTTAGLTALLPGLVHVKPRIVYLVVAVTMSVVSFLVLRRHIFHENEPVIPPGAVPGDQEEAIELELLGGGRMSGS